MKQFFSLMRSIAILCVSLAVAGPAYAAFKGDIISQPSSPMWDGVSYMDSLKATGAHRLHAIGITGQGVSAAVLDTPFDVTHPKIRDNIIVKAATGISLSGKGFTPYAKGMKYYETVNGIKYYKAHGLNAVAVPGLTDKSREEYETDDPDYYKKKFGTGKNAINHGTHVSGTVTAMAPGAGLVLITAAAWKEAEPKKRDASTMWAFETMEQGLLYTAKIASKYNIVAINNSWGDTTFEKFKAKNGQYKKAMKALYDAGVAAVVASGNDAMNELSPPANHDYVYSVGALRPDGMVGNFSNMPLEGYSGKENILMAPGVSINSSIPYPDESGKPRYESMFGTSMASPHVTGAFTLLASGARNASVDEIERALFQSADIIPYDGEQLIAPRKGDVADKTLKTLAEVEAAEPSIKLRVENIGDPTLSRTQDDWREVGRLRSLVVYWLEYREDLKKETLPEFLTYMLKDNEKKNTLYPYLGPLGKASFRFLRVDRAYQYLTNQRMNKRAQEVRGIHIAASEMLSAFAGELEAELDYESSQIFQRLDAQSGERLARVGRQMSPQWTSAAIEQGMLGVVGVHRSLGRRGDISRLTDLVNEACATALPFVAQSEDKEDSAPVPGSDPASDSGGPKPVKSLLGAGSLWVEGFGGGANRSGTAQRSDYSSHFAGSNLGFELKKGGFSYGLFGSIADYRASGSDGRSDGNWYSAGLYGRYDKGGFYGEASAAYTHASFDTNRSVDIPGASFSTPGGGTPLQLPGMSHKANSRNRMNGVSGRLAGGYDFELGSAGSSWYLGPRVEGSLVHGRVSGYKESGAGALNLSVDSFNQTYAETGAGLGAAYVYTRPDCGAVIASAKIMGVYGWSSGSDMTGKFKAQGSEFRISPKRHSGMWAVPEASLTWKVNERVGVSASYSGRFGKHYSENSGTLSVSIGF